MLNILYLWFLKVEISRYISIFWAEKNVQPNILSVATSSKEVSQTDTNILNKGESLLTLGVYCVVINY